MKRKMKKYFSFLLFCGLIYKLAYGCEDCVDFVADFPYNRIGQTTR